MTVYYVTLAAVAAMAAMAASRADGIGPEHSARVRFQTRFWLCAIILLLSCVAGLRYYVGTDYGPYYNGFLRYVAGLEEAIRSFDEPGIYIVATLVNLLTQDGAVFMFACSALTISMILIVTFRHTRAYLFASLLFVFIIWHGTFNGVRQYLASAILFAGHRLIYEKKFWKYAAVVFLATCFHISAVVMIIPFFLLRNKITLPNVLLLILGTVIVSANYDVVFSFVGELKGETIDTDTAYMSTSVNILRVLVNVAPALLCLFLYGGHRISSEATFYINALIINGAAMVAGRGSAYLARIGIYTSLFIPLAMAKLVVQRNKRDEALLKAIILLLYGVFWYIELSVNGALRTFRWIWER